MDATGDSTSCKVIYVKGLNVSSNFRVALIPENWLQYFFIRSRKYTESLDDIHVGD